MQWRSAANSAKRASQSGPPRSISLSAWLTGRAGLRVQQRRHRPSPFAFDRPANRTLPGRQRRSGPRAWPAPAGLVSDMARPATTRTRRFSGGRFGTAPARQATGAGLGTQHVATVGTRAGAAHATIGDGVEAQELLTVWAICTTLCFPVSDPAATAEHLGLAADTATATGAVRNRFKNRVSLSAASAGN